jgi:membrane-associated phospholipid phosphatase
MRIFFVTLVKNIGRTFVDFWPWHLVAFTATYVLVVSGFDWAYFKFFQGTVIYTFFFSAALIGGIAPILVPITLFARGKFKKNLEMTTVALALGQAAIIGSFISSLYKAFTGRVPPEIMSSAPITDISRIFHFGFFRGGIFWGWPSSHTTIAFAMAITLLLLYPRHKTIRYISLLYAIFIGIGVSMTIHWFSDFVAGAIIGTGVGITVAKSFPKY